MGEAMSEGTDFVPAKARALLEVVRLAFEGGIAFDPLDPTYATTVPDMSATADHHRHHVREESEQALPTPARAATLGSSSRLVPGGPCMWCGVTATPQWRRPRGTNRLLCNACGIFFTRYGRLPEKSQHIHSQPAHAASQSASLVPNMGRSVDSPMRTAHKQPGSLAETTGRPEVTAGQGHDPSDLQHTSYTHHRKSASSGSFQIGASPHKRKDAPQPETELLPCLQDSGANALVDIGASPSLMPLGSLTHSPGPGQPAPGPSNVAIGGHQQQLAAAAAVAAATAAATGAQDAECKPEPSGGLGSSLTGGGQGSALTTLTVAPLDLGLQHLGGMQQVGLLGQPLGCLAGLPPLSLHGSAAGIAQASGWAVTAGFGYPGPGAAAAAQPGRIPGGLSLLPPELMAGRQLALPPGLLTGRLPGLTCPTAAAAAASGGAPGRPLQLYARPAKRQERLPVGESDDSNVSADSHVAAAAGSASHDEDEGGAVTTTAPTVATKPGAASAFPSLTCSQPAVLALHTPLGAFSRPVAVPLLPGAASWTSSAGPVVGSAGSATGAGPFAPDPGVAGPAAVSPGELDGDYLQGQQPVIILHTRRSRGPRSRAISDTPSSSTQS